MHRAFRLIPLSLALAACGTEPAPPYIALDAGHRQTGQPALHAVHNGQLHELMGRMASLMQERFLTEPELDSERRRQARHISDTAQNLAQTIDAILATQPSLALNASEQGTFRALADKLREQTQTLRQQAEQNRLDAAAATLQQMDATCTACHALFRKL